ncbi:MAG: exonuclease domain-containing protein [Desulfofustis sp.]|jgi:DNA polymerase-3 subunit epsilon|nr:exonuclease domain-containing protein [Desulfofustis sp.]
MQRKHPSFWQLVFFSLVLTVIFIICILVFIWQRLDSSQVSALKDIAHDNAYHLLALITLVPVALWVIFEICYTKFYLPLQKIPSEVSVIYRTNPAHRLDIQGNRDIRELTEAINDFAKRYEYLNDHIALQIGKAREETEKDRNLLAAIMAELPLGIIICNSNGRILLFNSQAKKLFARAQAQRTSEYFLGLGRSIFHLVDQELINHALEEIQERLAEGKTRIASYFINQMDDQTLCLVETIPVLDEHQAVTGFVLSLQQLSVTLQRYDTISDQLITLRRLLNTELGRIELEFPATADENALPNRIRSRLATIGIEFENAAAAILDAAFETMPLGRIEIERLLFLIQQTAGREHSIRLNVLPFDRQARMLGDTYSFVAAFALLLEHLSLMSETDEFDLQVESSATDIVFLLSWQKRPVGSDRIGQVLEAKSNNLPRLGYVLKQNKVALQPLPGPDSTCRQIRISARAAPAIIPTAEYRSPVIAGSRPEYYDFNLFEIEDENQDLLNAALSSLTFSVIDTETTGLDPGSDEILSIGAVRIVKNRIIYQDRFDQLVNPSRDIPFESYKIHGIDQTMVAAQPTIEQVLPPFHRFLSDTVLIGHDISFDLKMLRRREQHCNLCFSNPALDTLLLSAALHPIHTQHDLQSVARRYGVTIVGRHTAMGDAIATAEIFLRLIPILQSKGIVTLEDAIKASKRIYFRRIRY